MTYIALIEKNPSSDYWVRAPDIPGCIADGNTAEQALDNFCQALAAHIAHPSVVLRPPRALQAVVNSEPYSGVALIEITDGKPSYSVLPGLVTPIQRMISPKPG